MDIAAVLVIARQMGAKDLKRQLRVAKIRQRTSLRVLPKLTQQADGTLKIIDDPPLIGHVDPEAFDGEKMIGVYAESLPPDRRPLLQRYRVLDTARKVVGVGSVGTRCYLSLLADPDLRSPLFLQLKEALEGVLAPYAGPSEFAHQGQRVVLGQRLMQAASDMFLGWTSYRGHDYYVRQFKDMKRSVNLDMMTRSASRATPRCAAGPWPGPTPGPVTRRPSRATWAAGPLSTRPSRGSRAATPGR